MVFVGDSFEATPLGKFLQAANLGLDGLVRISPRIDSGLLYQSNSFTLLNKMDDGWMIGRSFLLSASNGH
jgi:hypothetical protein